MKISSRLEMNNASRVNNADLNSGISQKNKSSSFKALPTKQLFLPEFIGEIGKRVGYYCNTPEQKLFMAFTALMFQPMIELKHAEPDKKQDAAIKSASKAIAGGLTGVTIRAAFLAATKALVGYDKNNSFNRHYFFPSAAFSVKKENEVLANIRMDQYTKALGSLFAVLFMIFYSNSKWDVPLTSDIQDFISGIVKDNKTWTKSLNDVLDKRKTQIKESILKRKNIINKINNKINKIIKAITDNDAESNKKSKETNK